MRDIASESGLSVGALYYYCRSKEELVLLFYERINAQINASFLQKPRESQSFSLLFSEFMQLKMSKLNKHR